MKRSPGFPGPFPDKAASKPVGRTSGDLIVMAVLVCVSRVLFGRKKSPVQRTLEGLGNTVSGHRGGMADKPSEIPARAGRTLFGVSTTGFRTTASCSWPLASFYALLALFPAIAAIVSLYGLFADASAINEHLKLISGFLPERR
jgi:membrane protein